MKQNNGHYNRKFRTINCKSCNKEFESNSSRKITCSDGCRDKWYFEKPNSPKDLRRVIVRKRETTANERDNYGNWQLRSCDYKGCNNTFLPKKFSHRFCCIRCAAAWRAERRYITMSCPICGAIYEAQAKRPRQYCGDVCYRVYMKQRQQQLRGAKIAKTEFQKVEEKKEMQLAVPVERTPLAQAKNDISNYFKNYGIVPKMISNDVWA